MGIWQNSFTRVIFQYKTYNFPSFQTFSFIGVLTLFDTNYLTDKQTDLLLFLNCDSELLTAVCLYRSRDRNILSICYVVVNTQRPQVASNTCMAPTMCALRDEIAAMRHEVMELKENAGRDIRALNDMNNVAQDVCEIKALLLKILQLSPQTMKENL